MRWVTLLTASLLVAGMAGCIGTSGNDETATPASTGIDAGDTVGAVGPVLADGTPAPTSLTFNSCREHLAVLPVPMEAADPLPDGFSYVPFDETGRLVTMLAVSYSCILSVELDLDTYDVDIETVDEMYGMWAVEPPAELARDGDALHTVLFGGFTSHEAFADVYDAWAVGQQIDVGDVSITDPVQGGQGHVGHAIGSDGEVTVHVYSGVTGPEGTQPAGSARSFSIVDGEVAGVMDVDWTESRQLANGEATLRIEGVDDPMATVFGAASPGIGIHNWGDNYAISVSYVDLGSLGAAAGDGE